MYYIDSDWLKCKHQNGTKLKGVACDCTSLIVGILADNGISIDVDYNYNAFWYTRKGCTELMLPYMEKYFDKVDTPIPGDCITYQFGRAKYSHISMYIGDGKIIHCNADFGVEVIHREELKNRESGFWRVKDGNL